jgi:hypothetical protein
LLVVFSPASYFLFCSVYFCSLFSGRWSFCHSLVFAIAFSVSCAFTQTHLDSRSSCVICSSLSLSLSVPRFLPSQSRHFLSFGSPRNLLHTDELLRLLFAAIFFHLFSVCSSLFASFIFIFRQPHLSILRRQSRATRFSSLFRYRVALFTFTREFGYESTGSLTVLTFQFLVVVVDFRPTLVRSPTLSLFLRPRLDCRPRHIRAHLHRFPSDKHFSLISHFVQFCRHIRTVASWRESCQPFAPTAYSSFITAIFFRSALTLLFSSPDRSDLTSSIASGALSS